MMNVLLISLFLGMQGIEQEPAFVRIGNWLPRLGGTIQDGGGVINVETNISLNDRASLPLIEFSLRPIENLTVSLSVFDFSTTGQGLFVGSKVFGSMPMTAGDRWTGSIDIRSVGFEGSWDVIKPFHASEYVTLTFAPIGGLRWYGVDTSMQNITTSQSVVHSNSWVALQVGLAMQFEWDTQDVTTIVESISIESKLLIGALFGGDGGSMWSMQAGIVMQFSQNIAGYFGYRLQELDAEDGSYVFSAGLQGLYVGGEIRF